MPDATCAKCGQPESHPHHDGNRWPGRLSTNHTYHPFVAAPAAVPRATTQREDALAALARIELTLRRYGSTPTSPNIRDVETIRAALTAEASR